MTVSGNPIEGKYMAEAGSVAYFLDGKQNFKCFGKFSFEFAGCVTSDGKMYISKHHIGNVSLDVKNGDDGELTKRFPELHKTFAEMISKRLCGITFPTTASTSIITKSEGESKDVLLGMMGEHLTLDINRDDIESGETWDIVNTQQGLPF